jgi:hypothetical protein
MEILMSMFEDTDYYTSEFEIEIVIDKGSKKLGLRLSDSSDCVRGYFRSVEDIELVIKELQQYVDEVKK